MHATRLVGLAGSGLAAAILGTAAAGGALAAAEPTPPPEPVETVELAGPLDILLTNDDGWSAPGISAVYDALVAAGHDVTLVAPATNQSGVSAQIEFSGELAVTHPTADTDIWSISTTPVGAVLFGVNQVLANDPPDLVVSGTNVGANTGFDTNFSGTIGAATVAAGMLDIPAVAISTAVSYGAEDEGAYAETAGLLVGMIEAGLPVPEDGALLNINYPKLTQDRPEPLGVRYAETASQSAVDLGYEQVDEDTWQIVPGRSSEQPDAGSDSALLAQGYVTVSVLDTDRSVAAADSKAVVELVHELNGTLASVVRIGGNDRYDTSAMIADEFAEQSANAVIANGAAGNFADALAANYLAGAKDAPILLVEQSTVPDEVARQLADLGVEHIWVVGGESKVSGDVVAALEREHTVTRVSGKDRFATSREVIEAGGDATGGVGLVATGFGFADALAGGPLALQGHPLALSAKGDINDELVDALQGAGVTEVLVLGGVSAVGEPVVAELEAEFDSVTRLAGGPGTGRAATSVQIANYATANLGFTVEGVNVASGHADGFGADALAGGPLSGKQDRPLLVSNGVGRPAEVLGYLAEHCVALADVAIFGGTAAVSSAAQAAMESAASCGAAGGDRE